VGRKIRKEDDNKTVGSRKLPGCEFGTFCYVTVLHAATRSRNGTCRNRREHGVRPCPRNGTTFIIRRGAYCNERNRFRRIPVWSTCAVECVSPASMPISPLSGADFGDRVMAIQSRPGNQLF